MYLANMYSRCCASTATFQLYNELVLYVYSSFWDAAVTPSQRIDSRRYTMQYNTIAPHCPVNGKFVYSIRIKKAKYL